MYVFTRNDFKAATTVNVRRLRDSRARPRRYRNETRRSLTRRHTRFYCTTRGRPFFRTPPGQTRTISYTRDFIPFDAPPPSPTTVTGSFRNHRRDPSAFHVRPPPPKDTRDGTPGNLLRARAWPAVARCESRSSSFSVVVIYGPLARADVVICVSYKVVSVLDFFYFHFVILSFVFVPYACTRTHIYPYARTPSGVSDKYGRA